QGDKTCFIALPAVENTNFNKSLTLKGQLFYCLINGIDHFGFTFLDSKSFEEYKEKLKQELNKRGIPYEEKEHHDGSKSLFFNEINGYKIQIVYLPPYYFKG
ncbi:hypothetical protein COT27_00540, partial [Candidatus Kuenenbacteria bacterium CG08_land_8_20_14_0_20_37_23]